MILTGDEIKKRIGRDIKIKPFNKNQLGPNSYNLRLSRELITYNDFTLDCKKKNTTQPILFRDIGLQLSPGTLYLGRTIEHTTTKNLVPMLEGISSYGRLGISIHVTAGFGDIGFNGYWTLEITCVQPVIIYPGMIIAQIYYNTVCGTIGKTYNGKYQNNTGVDSSKSYKNFV